MKLLFSFIVILVALKAEVIDSSYDLPVTQWSGKRFYILPKQKILQQFGYELYCTPQMDKTTTKPDGDLETLQRHVRCDKFGNTTIVVLEVKSAGNEYCVKFSHEQTGIVLYGKTRKRAIEGLALAEDLEKAREQWLGKTIYSARRFIDIYDSVSGKISTLKVHIEDPLKVVNVAWGQTPLPPKPIWLAVETPKGEKGFIPACRSWANVMLDKKNSAAPWNDDVLDQNPKKLYSWDNAVWETINNHSIIRGMTGRQVRMSWGPPKSVIDNHAGKTGEQWRYDNGQILHFVRDSLVSIEGQ